MSIRAVLGVVIALAVLGGFDLSANGATPRLPKAADFSARVDNPWYPLIAGTRYVYRGVKDGEPSREVLTVTHRTKVIDGAPAS